MISYNGKIKLRLHRRLTIIVEVAEVQQRGEDLEQLPDLLLLEHEHLHG